MAIHMSSAPDEGANMVQRNVVPPPCDTTWIAHGAAIDAAEHGARRIEKSYAVFSARLEDVLAEDRGLLDSARLLSWQYVVFEGNRVVALAEVAAGDPLQYASQQSPAVAEAVLKAIREAETLDDVKKSDYELRILRVPELYLLAVWLHAPGKDLLLPVRPFTKLRGGGRSLTEKQVVAALRPLAQVRAATADA